MLEVERKARIKDRSEIISKLDKLGCIIKKAKEQEDKIFIRKEIKKLDSYSKQTEFMVDNKIETIEDNNAFIELETLIEDADIISRMLEEMGYIEKVFIKKKRMRYSLDKMSICIDNIESLGNFIEVEILSEENEKQKNEALKTIEEFLNKLEISKEDYEEKRYDTLMYELNNK